MYDISGNISDKDKEIVNRVFNIAKATIAFDMDNGVKAMTDEESFQWHKRYSRIDPETGNLIISSDEIGDGTFEQKYKK